MLLRLSWDGCSSPLTPSITSWEEDIPHACDMNIPHYGPKHMGKGIVSSITGNSPEDRPQIWGVGFRMLVVTLEY